MLTLSALSPTTSVFVTGSHILRMAGTGATLAVLIGGLIVLLVLLVAAELASAFPSAGGVYPGIGAVLGPSAGTSVATLALFTTPPFLAFLALGFASYLHAIFPGVPIISGGIAALAVAMALATLHIRTDVRITGAVLLIELLALGLLAGVALASPARGAAQVLLHPVMLVGGQLASTPPWTVVFATIAGAFACTGAATASFFADDLKGAPSLIGRWIVVTALVSLLTIAGPIVLVTIGAHDLPDVLAADAPIARYLQTATSPTVGLLATGAVAAAVLNNLIAYLVASSRMLFASSRDGLWPRSVSRRFARLHPRFGSPAPAAAALGGVAMLLCLIEPGKLLVLVSGEVFTSLLLVLAVAIGRRRGLTGAQTFRSPLFPLAPLAGLMAIAAFCVADWHDASAGRPSLLLLAAVAVTAFVVDRRYRRRAAADQQSV